MSSNPPTRWVGERARVWSISIAPQKSMNIGFGFWRHLAELGGFGPRLRGLLGPGGSFSTSEPVYWRLIYEDEVSRDEIEFGVAALLRIAWDVEELDQSSGVRYTIQALGGA